MLWLLFSSVSWSLKTLCWMTIGIPAESICIAFRTPFPGVRRATPRYLNFISPKQDIEWQTLGHEKKVQVANLHVAYPACWCSVIRSKRQSEWTCCKWSSALKNWASTGAEGEHKISISWSESINVLKNESIMIRCMSQADLHRQKLTTCACKKFNIDSIKIITFYFASLLLAQ